jgi:hypothetical protein
MAVLLHALFPRYQCHADARLAAMIRVDRWTGHTEYGSVSSGSWMPIAASRAEWQPFSSTDPTAAAPLAGASSVPALDARAKPPHGVAVPLSIARSEPAVMRVDTGDLRRSLDGVRATPGKIVERSRATCADDGAVRPDSGAGRAGKEARRGSGKLQIDNRTGSDTVATLLEDPDGTPRRVMFIRRGASGVITFVQPGRYRLRFQPASDGPVRRLVCGHTGASEFDEAFDFREVSSEGGRRHATYHVTLHKRVASTTGGGAVPATSSRFCIS